MTPLNPEAGGQGLAVAAGSKGDELLGWSGPQRDFFGLPLLLTAPLSSAVPVNTEQRIGACRSPVEQHHLSELL